MRRNGEVDILRFVFVTIIATFHYGRIWPLLLGKNGNFGVEFFFLLSGLLMAKSAFRIQQEKARVEELPSLVVNFILRKIKTFYKYFLALFAISYTVYGIAEHWNIKIIICKLLESIPYHLFIEMFGMQTGANAMLGISWYLSAMLIAIALLLPILLWNYDRAQKIIFPLICCIVFGYLYGNFQKVSGGTTQWLGFTYFATLRGIAEIALGSICFELSRVLSKTQITNVGKNEFTLIKIICFGSAVAYSISAMNTSYSLSIMILLAIGLIISFSDISHTIQQNALTTWLGKISLPIYLFHQIVRKVQFLMVGKEISTDKCIGLILISITVSIILMYIVDYIAKIITEKHTAGNKEMISI